MLLCICLISNRKLFQWSATTLYCGNIPGSVCLWNPCVCGVCGGAYSGVEPPSFIHGQESVTVDTFDANDPLRNCKELQDTWVDKQHALMMDGWSRCIFTSHDICSISSLQMTSVVSRWLHCSALKRHNTNYSKSVLKIIALLWPSELGSLFNRCFWLSCLMLHGGKIVHIDVEKIFPQWLTWHCLWFWQQQRSKRKGHPLQAEMHKGWLV